MILTDDEECKVSNETAQASTDPSSLIPPIKGIFYFSSYLLSTLLHF